jgi:hypothetical protein
MTQKEAKEKFDELAAYYGIAGILDALADYCDEQAEEYGSTPSGVLYDTCSRLVGRYAREVRKTLGS